MDVVQNPLLKKPPYVKVKEKKKKYIFPLLNDYGVSRYTTTVNVVLFSILLLLFEKRLNIAATQPCRDVVDSMMKTM